MTKNQLLRFKIINRCLRDFSRLYGWRDLADDCIDALSAVDGQRESLSRKTIHNDIKYIESEHGYALKIIRTKIGRNVYYRYADESITIDKQPLSQNELERFKEAITTLSSISGRNEFDYISDLLPRLETSLNVQLDTTPIIDYQNNEDLRNNHLVHEIYQHIRSRRVLDIEYKNFKNEIYNYKLHPYFLKQYNNRWFLFGYDAEVKENYGIHPLNLPIDRIEEMTSTEIDYIPNDDIDFATYFDEIIGVTKYANTETAAVQIKIHPNTAPYIENKPLHPYQKKLREREDGYFYTSLDVVPNHELYALILSYGPSVEIISPKTVRDEMQLRVKKMASHYT